MAAYWVNTFVEIRDADRFAQYAALAGPAMLDGGGECLARGEPAAVLEGAPSPRVSVIRFPSVEAAVAAYRSAAYQEALAVLGDGATREIRVIDGVA